MLRRSRPYPLEFRRQIVELARASKLPSTSDTGCLWSLGGRRAYKGAIRGRQKGNPG